MEQRRSGAAEFRPRLSGGRGLETSLLIGKLVFSGGAAELRQRQEVLGWEIDVHGGSSQALTGEIGLSEIQNVFAEVSISSERIKLLQKSLRETHFEATVTRFEYSSKFMRKSK